MNGTEALGSQRASRPAVRDSLPRVGSVFAAPWISRFADRAFARLGVTVILETGVGVKGLNQLISSDLFEHHRRAEPVRRSPDELLLGLDGLRDRTSLIGVPVGRSPHVALVRAIEAGTLDIRNEYLARVAAGVLDLRFARRITPAYLEHLKMRCERVLAEVDAGSSLEVKVFSIGSATYIADGKHRAAAAVLRGADVTTVDVTSALFDSYYMSIVRRMRKTPDVYRRHLTFIEAAQSATGRVTA